MYTLACTTKLQKRSTILLLVIWLWHATATKTGMDRYSKRRSGRVERRSYANDFKWIPVPQKGMDRMDRGRVSGVWIPLSGVLDRDLSGPYILSCSHFMPFQHIVTLPEPASCQNVLNHVESNLALCQTLEGIQNSKAGLASPGRAWPQLLPAAQWGKISGPAGAIFHSTQRESEGEKQWSTTWDQYQIN